MERDTGAGPYGSARDLPSFVELEKQLKGMKMITRVIGRSLRPKLLEIEQQANKLANTVDAFYSILGDRNWVFHDDMNLSSIERVAEAPTPDEAETRLIDMYMNPKTLEFMVLRLSGSPAMLPRKHLIDKALVDYRDGRYYSTVLVLLTVMDGFVNDVESKRQGLHARSAEELFAWDSVVGHHMGLSHAHATFQKGFRKTKRDEVFDLFRNGILHGMILEYDNQVVATKAWNRLFAVADWAKSLERRTLPPEPQPTFREAWRKLLSNAANQQAIKNWSPSTLLSEDEGFLDTTVATSAKRFLDAWKARNYGQMAHLFPDHVISFKPASKPARVRSLFEALALDEYVIEKVDFTAPAAAEVDVTVTVNGSVESITMRWIRDDPHTGHATPIEEKGEWKLYIGLFEAMKQRRAKE